MFKGLLFHRIRVFAFLLCCFSFPALAADVNLPGSNCNPTLDPLCQPKDGKLPDIDVCIDRVTGKEIPCTPPEPDPKCLWGHLDGIYSGRFIYKTRADAVKGFCPGGLTNKTKGNDLWCQGGGHYTIGLNPSCSEPKPKPTEPKPDKPGDGGSLPGDSAGVGTDAYCKANPDKCKHDGGSGSTGGGSSGGGTGSASGVSGGGSGSASGVSGGGSGSGGSSGGKGKDGEDGKDGDGMSEYCRKNPDALACTAFAKLKEFFGGSEEASEVGELKIPSKEDTRVWSPDGFLASGGTCPADKQFNLAGRSFTLSYANVCKFLAMIRPMVIAVCMFFSGLMVFNTIRS